MWVLHWPGGNAQANASLSIYDVASGALLQTRALSKPASSMKYSRSRHILIAIDGSQRTSYDYTPGTQTFAQRGMTQ